MPSTVHTLSFGQLGYINKKAWVDGAYTQKSLVRHNNAMYEALEDIVAGETPGSSAKWELWVDGNAITAAPNSVLVTDSSGERSEIAGVDGQVLQYSTSNGFEFVALPIIPASVAPVTVKHLPSAVSPNYGAIFVGSDDNIYTAGYYASNVVHNSMGSFNNPNFRAIGVDGARTGIWTKLIVGYYFVMAITSTGELWVAGYNNSKYLGLPTAQSYGNLTKITSVTGVVDIAATGLGTTNFTLAAVTDLHKMFAVGYGGYGQTGQGANTSLQEWTEVDTSALNGGARKVFGSTQHQYGGFIVADNASSDDGWGVGYNGYGQLGNSSTVTKNVLTKFTAAITGKIVKATIDGAYSSYTSSKVLTDSDAIWAAGSGSYGNTGINNAGSVTLFTKWAGGDIYKSLASVDAYAGTTFSTTTAKDFVMAGYNGYYVAGDGTATQHNVPFTPTIVETGLQGKAVDVCSTPSYNQHGCVIICDDGSAWHTGSRTQGQQGAGSTTDTHHAVKISGVANAVAASFFGSATNTGIIIQTSGSNPDYILGYNGHGECGVGVIGGAVMTATPIKV